MWMNESAANSILAPPVSGLKDALFRPSLPSKPKTKKSGKEQELQNRHGNAKRKNLRPSRDEAMGGEFHVDLVQSGFRFCFDEVRQVG